MYEHQRKIKEFLTALDVTAPGVESEPKVQTQSPTGANAQSGLGVLEVVLGTAIVSIITMLTTGFSI